MQVCGCDTRDVGLREGGGFNDCVCGRSTPLAGSRIRGVLSNRCRFLLGDPCGLYERFCVRYVDGVVQPEAVMSCRERP